jgi:hypothetical protein
MKLKKLTTLAVATAMLLTAPAASYAGTWCPPVSKFTPTGGSSSAPWFVIGCAGGVVLAALAANYRDQRELTAAEAWSCGTLFLVSKPKHKRYRHR